MKKLAALLLALCAFYGVTAQRISKIFFGEADGQKIWQYTLQNSKGMQVKVINYGATITDIITPDKDGHMGDVVLGFDSLKQYISKDNARMGAIRGRVTNRIANNRFIVDGKEYNVITSKNGEVMGTNKKIWNIEEVPGKKEVSLKVTYLSKNGEEGFPGNLNLTVLYTLTNANELKINYTVTTDQPTPVVLTSHSYFNLSGGKEDKVLNTEVQFFASQYLETGKGGIPDGNLLAVKGTPFDFTSPQSIGKRIQDFNNGDGYDLTYALRNQSGKLALAAVAYEPASGRIMKTYTTEPGVVFYTGNALNEKLRGKGGKPFTKHGAFCLETQHYPDSPNQPKFASVILRPGETFRSETVYQFSVKK
ncbi:aldose epimerase family protein [Mucilaginibacter sp. dw_454]|uniref:aldose epimerase family protein n=1 Tax=Mucilaginibacter sp. dw_454 TaxID=2720079 RepID=UPI001BD47458|nr:aldose epimerase family protein [Mucilaginibacter sp. dw_454]